MFFCSTALPSTGWVQSTYKAFIALSFCCQLTRQHQEEKAWKRRDSNLGRLGVERERYLCAMAAPSNQRQALRNELK